MPTVTHLIDGITLLPLIDKDAIVYVYAVTLELGDVGCVSSHLLNGDILSLAPTEYECDYTSRDNVDYHPSDCVSFLPIHKPNYLVCIKITPLNCLCTLTDNARVTICFLYLWDLNGL